MTSTSSLTRGPLFDYLLSRTMHEKEEGDIAYFHSLIMSIEYLIKVVTLGVISCIGDDADRHRYSLEHRLVRANSIGDWVELLNSALTGPAAQFFIPRTQVISRTLTERVSSEDWRYEIVQSISMAREEFEQIAKPKQKVALRQFFQDAAYLRNRTRGHGSPTGYQCGKISPLLENAINIFITHFPLFQYDWVYLHRNLSGKYRVSPILGKCLGCEHLKKNRDITLQNGVYIDIEGLIFVPLLFSDPEVRDFFVPNGNFSSNSFEVLSYVTNNIKKPKASQWSLPPGRLQESETEGFSGLEPNGNLFSNHPPMHLGYISREKLEARVSKELLKIDRHPIVTLTGPGGIGKTTIALAVINEICKLEHPPYSVVLWLSSRDIDLLESGPKPVSPKVLNHESIAKAAVELLEPAERIQKGFEPVKYFENCLAKGAAGTTLFVFDNFETLTSPSDVFTWIDTHIRHPNKVIITTRFRDFAGDYPIEIGGMTDEEAIRLIDHEAVRLSITALINQHYKEELIAESDGHPYVMKILLGQVDKEQNAVKPARIVADADRLLTALFERTFENLTPAAQRVFLLLCSWRVFVPSIAVEAVSLRPGNERFNILVALEELRRFSLIDEVISEEDGENFIGVPLAAASYGRRKLEISPMKIAVEEDRKLLTEFGAGKRLDAHNGVLPRVDKLVQSAALKAAKDPSVLEQFVPILEYIASRVPQTYLRLADLIIEIGGDLESIESAKKYLRLYLPSVKDQDLAWVWMKLADLCADTGDAFSEVHALSEAALSPTVSPEQMGVIANKINNRIRELKGKKVEEAWLPEVRKLIQRVADVLRKYLKELTATDCSRLAWLYLNIGMPDTAREIAEYGLKIEPTNEHCQNLVQKLG